MGQDPPETHGPGASRCAVVRVGVGVVVLLAQEQAADGDTHPTTSKKLYAGRRKGSHGASKLALPGGHLEVNESWEECAVREVQEEMGLHLTNVEFLHVTNDIMLDDEKHYVTIFMVGNITDGSSEPVNREPEKCEGWEAYTLEELSAMVGRDELFGPLEKLLAEKPAKLLELFQNDE